jgi:hypothetical protein
MVKDSFAHKEFVFAWCDFQWENGDLHQVDREYLITGKQVQYVVEIALTTNYWEAKSLYFGNRVASFPNIAATSEWK